MIEPADSLKRLSSFNKFGFFWTLFGLLVHILGLISGIFIFAFLISNPLDEEKYWFAPYTFYFLIPIVANNFILSLLGIAQLARFKESVKCFRYMLSLLRQRKSSKSRPQVERDSTVQSSDKIQSTQGSDDGQSGFKTRSRFSSTTEKSAYQL